MSEVEQINIPTASRDKFNQLKKKNKRNFNLFLPGFCFGVFIHRMSKMYVSMEHPVARPWAAIWWGLIMGSVFHYWSWKKRLILEELCIREELRERVILERTMRKLKAGHDIENHMMMNYLKNEHNI